MVLANLQMFLSTTFTLTSYGSLTHIIEAAIEVFILGKILERQREVINLIYTDLQIFQL